MKDRPINKSFNDGKVLVITKKKPKPPKPPKPMKPSKPKKKG